MPFPSQLAPAALLALGLATSLSAGAQVDRTVYLATVGTQPTDTVRLFARAATDSLAVCREAADGTVAMAADFSASYRARDGFFGEDRYCATVCAPDGETDCETVELVVTVLNPANAVRESLRNVGDQEFVACADLPFGGPYAQPQVRRVDPLFTPGAPATDPSCLRLDPVDGATGTGEVEAIFCSATNPSFCRQVIFTIEQAGACPSPAFATDTVRLAAAPAPYRHCLAGGADLAGYDILLNGGAYRPLRSPDCGATVGGGVGQQFLYDLRFAPAQAGATFELDAWRVDGVERVGTFGSLAELADSMSVWDPVNDWRYEASAPELVADGNLGDPGILVLTLDPAAGSNAFVRDERSVDQQPGTGAVVELPRAGWHVVELRDAAGDCGERQAIYLAPDRSPRVDTVDFVVRAGSDNPGLCVPLDDLYGEAPSSVEILTQPARGVLRVEDFRCFALDVEDFTGRDTASVVLCSSRLGLCDTTVLAFAVGQTCDSISLASAPFRETGNCRAGLGFDFLASPVERLADLAVFVDGSSSSFLADTAGFSVVVPVGRHVVTVRDAGRACFIDFEVEVECVACPEPLPERITLDVNCGAAVQGVCLPLSPAELAEYVVTLDDAEVAGPFEACNGGSLLAVDATLPGQTLRIVHRDNDCADESDLVYRCRESSVVFDTLLVGELRSYCVEPAGLLGEATRAEAVCPTTGDLLEVVTTETPLCFDLAAVGAGSERVCYVVCDDAGACDTTFYEIAIGYPLRADLAAFDDSLFAVAGREHAFALVANDFLTSNEYTVTVLDGPVYGAASVDAAGTLTYRAPETACDQVDSLSYSLCVDTTCRTAVARIAVRCEPVMVYEGFSPNGDGINDEMVVVGLEELSSYRLEVFSRWGTRVFESSDYANDWDGTWSEGQLPDGPQFYVVTYTERDGTTGVVTGCTYLMR